MSTIHLDVLPQSVIVRLPLPPGRIMVDYREEIKKGHDWEGLSYAELRAMGSGQHEIVDREE